MTTPFRTPEGVVLDQLVHTLTQIATDDSIQGWAWQQAMTEAFLGAIGVYPLDDDFFGMLLSWSGFNLGDADHLHLAVAFTAFLTGTGVVELRCSHAAGDASPLCARLAAGEGAAARAIGAEAVNSDRLQSVVQAGVQRFADACAALADAGLEGLDDAA